MPLPDRLAKFNRRVTNPVIGRVSGKAGPLAVIEHRGRRSGRLYRTPVMAFPSDEGWVVPLTYGAERDWVRNVRAAGEADLVIRGERMRVTDPLIVPADGVPLPRAARAVLVAVRAPDVLELRTAG